MHGIPQEKALRVVLHVQAPWVVLLEEVWVLVVQQVRALVGSHFLGFHLVLAQRWAADWVADQVEHP